MTTETAVKEFSGGALLGRYLAWASKKGSRGTGRSPDMMNKILDIPDKRRQADWVARLQC